jgi:ribosomal protein S27E
MSERKKTAKIHVQSVEVLCPYKDCGETIVEPNSGSVYWTVNEMNVDSVLCKFCGREVKLPKL